MNLIRQRWIIVIALLSVTIFYVEFVPFGEGTPLRRDFQQFPVQLGEWVQTKGEKMTEFDSLPQADVHVLRRYKTGSGEALSLYVGYLRKFQHGRSLFEGKNLSPGKRWIPQKSSQNKIKFGERLLKVNEIKFKKENDYLIVTYWYLMGETGLTNKGIGRIKQALSAMLNQRTDAVLIMVWSLSPSVREIENHQARHARFIQAMVPSLMEFLPYEL